MLYTMQYNSDSPDIVRALGLLALGTRFKRLGERLQADTQVILDALDRSVPAAQQPLLFAIERHGPLTVGALAEHLGVSQPGVTRALGQLARAELVAIETAAEDGRRRLLSLTPAGRAFVAAARAEAWPRVEAAVADLCSGFAGELLEHLAAIEDRLRERPLAERAAARVDEAGEPLATPSADERHVRT